MSKQLCELFKIRTQAVQQLNTSIKNQTEAAALGDVAAMDKSVDAYNEQVSHLKLIDDAIADLQGNNTQVKTLETALKTEKQAADVVAHRAADYFAKISELQCSEAKLKDSLTYAQSQAMKFERQLQSEKRLVHSQEALINDQDEFIDKLQAKLDEGELPSLLEYSEFGRESEEKVTATIALLQKLSCSLIGAESFTYSFSGAQSDENTTSPHQALDLLEKATNMLVDAVAGG